MKNKKIIRTFAATLAVMLCFAAFSTTAFAGGVDPDPEPLPETTEAPEEVPEETEEPTTGGIEMEPEGVPVTPEGNAALVDDFYGDKQLITVTTKAGNYFYILIDRANEDKETSVHFLNQVDDADLQALLEDGEAEPEVCTCAEKCEAGAVNTACPVCKNNLTVCVGAAPEDEEPAETAKPEEAGNSMGGLIVFLVVLLIGGGAALYFFKFKKPKADTKGNDDLDEYDFGEDEDDDEDEPAPEVDDDTGEVEARPLDDYLLDEDEPKKEDEE